MTRATGQRLDDVVRHAVSRCAQALTRRWVLPRPHMRRRHRRRSAAPSAGPPASASRPANGWAPSCAALMTCGMFQLHGVRLYQPGAALSTTWSACVAELPQLPAEYANRYLSMLLGSAVKRMGPQVRHSRVTAVWDDEPVPAVPSPMDQTPAPPPRPTQHATQARQRRVVTPARTRAPAALPASTTSKHLDVWTLLDHQYSYS